LLAQKTIDTLELSSYDYSDQRFFEIISQTNFSLDFDSLGSDTAVVFKHNPKYQNEFTLALTKFKKKEREKLNLNKYVEIQPYYLALSRNAGYDSRNMCGFGSSHNCFNSNDPQFEYSFHFGNHFNLQNTHEEFQNAMAPFWVSQFEITNIEYREFTNYVRDSIARRLLSAHYPDEYLIEGTTHLNWEVDLLWGRKTKEIDFIKILNGLYLPPHERFYNRRDIDVKQLTYLFPDGKSLRIYPDTSAWYEIGSEVMGNMYFWHPSYDFHPCVGISYQQAQAYCHWKSKQLQKQFKNPNICMTLPTLQEWDYIIRKPEANSFVELMEKKAIEQELPLKKRKYQNARAFIPWRIHDTFDENSLVICFEQSSWDKNAYNSYQFYNWEVPFYGMGYQSIFDFKDSYPYLINLGSSASELLYDVRNDSVLVIGNNNMDKRALTDQKPDFNVYLKTRIPVNKAYHNVSFRPIIKFKNQEPFVLTPSMDQMMAAYQKAALSFFKRHRWTISSLGDSLIFDICRRSDTCGHLDTEKGILYSTAPFNYTINPSENSISDTTFVGRKWSGVRDAVVFQQIFPNGIWDFKIKNGLWYSVGEDKWYRLQYEYPERFYLIPQ
jgi:hypothetical protein